MVNIYCDSANGKFKKSFRITTFIWGDQAVCQSFESEIKRCVENRGWLLPNSTFHASRVHNWALRIKVFEWLLKKIACCVTAGQLKVLTYFESEKILDENAKILFKPIERAFSNPAHPIQNVYAEVPESDRKVSLHRIPSLFYFLKFRDRFGNAHEHFNFYPDSSSNVLSMQNNSLAFHGTIARNVRPHYKTFANSANAAIEVFENTNWQGLYNSRPLQGEALSKFWKLQKGLPNQVVKEFKPTDDKQSYLIQGADVISNFWLSALRFENGLDTESYRHSALLKFIDQKTFDRLSQYFETGLEEIICKSDCDEIVDYFRL